MKKERYELFGKYKIKENGENVNCRLFDTYETCIILNQQDARIKELEDMVVKKQNRLYSRFADIKNLHEENQQLKIENGSLKEIVLILTDQLKQSQNSKAIEVLEQLSRDIWTDQQDKKVDLYYLSETIDNQIKELRGE